MLELLGVRERRWLLVFLVLGSAYLGLLLVERVIGVLGGFSQIFLILFLAWLLAFVMAPVVGWLHARTPIARGALVAIVYAFALLGMGFALFYAASAITEQVGQLTEDFPETEARLRRTLAGWQESIEFGRFRPDLVGLFEDSRRQIAGLGAAIFQQGGEILRVTAAVIGALVLVIIISMYMVLDSERILAKLSRVVPNRWEEELEIFERSVVRAFGGFLRAQLVLAAIQAILTGSIGLLIGLPYLFLVGTLSALAMLIPFFGPPLALIPPVIATALFRPEWLLLVAPVLLVTQTVIVNWVQPRLMQGALGMHPILVLVGLLVGAQVAGVWGALFGIPVIAVLNVFFNYLVNLRAIEEADEVDTDAVVEEVGRAVPGAPKEVVVALAAERAEEAHQEAQAGSVARGAAAGELRRSATEMHAAARESRRAAGDIGASASAMRESAEEVRATTGELKETVEQLAERPAADG